MKASKSISETGVYNESMRYLENAIDILNTKAKRDGDYYLDKKYVKMAGHTAYTGVLYALNSMSLISLKKGQRADVRDYQEALGKHNKKILNYFNDCYEQLHLVAGYDGYGHKKVFSIAFSSAEQIIKWAAHKAA